MIKYTFNINLFIYLKEIKKS